jgi:hypothetical protein
MCLVLRDESKNERKPMNQSMQALKAVQSIQGADTNPNKTKVRFAIRQQIEAFVKKYRNLFLISLPSTEWLIERDLLKSCKNENLPCHIIGLEKDVTKPYIFDVMKENAPKGNNIEVENEDFDDYLKHGINQICGSTTDGLDSLDFDENVPNVFWADYCGNFLCRSNGFGEKYPNINTFFYTVKSYQESKTPFLYYMTFNLMGRMPEGRKGKTALQFAQEVKNVIQMYCAYHNLTNIIPILSVVYKGAMGKDARGQQTMITLGFAVNMAKAENGQFWHYLNDLPASFPFKPFKAKWLKNEIHPIVKKEKKAKKNTLASSTYSFWNNWRTSNEQKKSKIIGILLDNGVPNNCISNFIVAKYGVLSISKNSVRAYKARHNNKNSWK